MGIMKSVRGGVSGALDFAVAKNRKHALISKVKHVIAEEEHRANEAYIALGKYYYNNLRDAENNETEFYCAEVDNAERRMQRAEIKLDELTTTQKETIDEFDDEEFELFCRECEINGVDGCEGCRPLTEIQEDWDEESVEVFINQEEVKGIDVDLPPQVRDEMAAADEKESLKDKAEAVAEKVEDAIENAVETVKDKVENIVEAVKDKLDGEDK